MPERLGYVAVDQGMVEAITRKVAQPVLGSKGLNVDAFRREQKVSGHFVAAPHSPKLPHSKAQAVQRI